MVSFEQCRKLGIGQCDPAPGGDAVGDIGELFRPDRCVFREELGFYQLTVQGSNSIDMVGSHCGKVGHPHCLTALFVNDRHTAKT